ncbi:MAG: DinB family protein [Desulfovibrio sp.]|nr:DinB family protein [Desulfovibrio sp.]
MSRDITNAIEGPYRHSWSLLVQLIDTCPDKIWGEKRGGWPFWQQVAHTLAVLNFLTLAENEEPLPSPCDTDTLMLKVQGSCVMGKDAMRTYAESVRVSVDAWLAGISDSDLANVNTLLSKKMGRDIALGATIAMLASHTCYHVGSCDAVLRENGLPGVF